MAECYQVLYSYCLYLIERFCLCSHQSEEAIGENCKQLRNSESRINSLLLGRVNQMLSKYQIFSPGNIYIQVTLDGLIG